MVSFALQRSPVHASQPIPLHHRISPLKQRTRRKAFALSVCGFPASSSGSMSSVSAPSDRLEVAARASRALASAKLNLPRLGSPYRGLPLLTKTLLFVGQEAKHWDQDRSRSQAYEPSEEFRFPRRSPAGPPVREGVPPLPRPPSWPSHSKRDRDGRRRPSVEAACRPAELGINRVRRRFAR